MVDHSNTEYDDLLRWYREITVNGPATQQYLNDVGLELRTRLRAYDMLTSALEYIRRGGTFDMVQPFIGPKNKDKNEV